MATKSMNEKEERRLKLALSVALGVTSIEHLENSEFELLGVPRGVRMIAKSACADIIFEAITKKMEVLLKTEPWSKMQQIDTVANVIEKTPSYFDKFDLETAFVTNPFRRTKTDDLVEALTFAVYGAKKWWSSYDARRNAFEILRNGIRNIPGSGLTGLKHEATLLWNHTVAADILIMELQEELNKKLPLTESFWQVYQSVDGSAYMALDGLAFTNIAAAKTYCETYFPGIARAKSSWEYDSEGDGAGNQRGWKKSWFMKKIGGHFEDGAEPHWICISERKLRS